jgi:hypothetical protein
MRRVHQDCSTIYVDFIGLIFQLCETAYYTRALREQNAIIIFSLPNKYIRLMS